MKATPVRVLFAACAEAISEKENVGFARSFDLLARAVTRRIEQHLRGAGTPESTLPDLRQEALIKLLSALREGQILESPEAWLGTVCKRLAIDRHRRTAGHTFISLNEEPVGDDSCSSERELLGKKSMENQEAPERVLDASRAAHQVFSAMTAYAERAEGQPARGHQVVAWFGVQVLGASTTQVLEAIAKRYGRVAKSDTLWQWKRRGGALVKELATSDDDRARRAMMLRLVAQAAQPLSRTVSRRSPTALR